MRIYIKGGAWKNVEDEILKTAVMKYGKNNWPIIASLLPRKSAKQCKARWYEWLDPDIKKTEWSRDEDEKLLHLAKIFPTQWRTIAPAVGRTAAQCLERYEQLLDEAQQREGAEIYDPNSILNPRRLRPGEIDPNPENKPAKPDTIDMDEDELEMLSEAKARLSNTLGKKEKRKAREAAMEEERRLASVQRARELKAAGIRSNGSSKYSRKLTTSGKKRHFAKLDVNKEIPFHHKPQPGFYDTTAESAQKDKLELGKSIEEIEGRRRMDVEREKRREDKRKQALRQKLNLPEHFKKLNRMHEETHVLDQREKMSLPQPQVTDNELEQIGRMGHQIERDSATSGAGGKVTRGLLADYKATPASATPGLTPGATPHSSATGSTAGGKALTRTERLMLQARNLANLSRSQTPLLGGENTPLNETFDDFQGVKPTRQSSVRSTPMGNMATPVMTPRSGGASAQASATPLHRDQFRINDASLTEEEERLHYDSILTQLKDSLKSLPKPKAITGKLRTRIQIQGEDGKKDGEGSQVRDAADIEAEKQRALKRQREEELERRSEAVKRNLPRPKELTKETTQLMRSQFEKLTLAPEDEMTDEDTTTHAENNNALLKKAQESILTEMRSMIQHDAALHPHTRSTDKSSKKRKRTHENLQQLPLNLLKQANQLLESEYNSTSDKSHIDTTTFSKLWNEQFNQLQDENQSQEENALAKLIAKYEKKIEKLQKTCSLYQAGYRTREGDLLSEIAKLCMQLSTERINSDSYNHIASLEQSSGPIRLQKLENQVSEQRKQNGRLQREYNELKEQLQELEEQQDAESLVGKFRDYHTRLQESKNDVMQAF